MVLAAGAYSGLIGVLLFVSAPLLVVFLGAAFEPAAAVMRGLAPIPLLRSIRYFSANALTGAGRHGWRTSLQVLTAVANVGLNAWLIPSYGVRGAVWATLACEAFLGVCLWAVVLGLLARGANASESSPTAESVRR
jgi:O-antigen/teichoic acid export membrane protein